MLLDKLLHHLCSYSSFEVYLEYFSGQEFNTSDVKVFQEFKTQRPTNLVYLLWECRDSSLQRIKNKQAIEDAIKAKKEFKKQVLAFFIERVQSSFAPKVLNLLGFVVHVENVHETQNQSEGIVDHSAIKDYYCG